MNKPKEIQNRDTREIHANIIWISLALVVTVMCFAINLGGAWMGGQANPLQFIMTAVYIIFWAMFTFHTRKQSAPVWVSVVISLLTSVGAVNSLLMRLIHSGFILMAILSTFASVPFYGLRFMMDWTLLYAVTSIISLLWLIYSLRNLHFIRKKGIQMEKR